MKKFKIIEEGRLSNYDQAQITGGGILICTSKGDTRYSTTCFAEKVTCPYLYFSCGAGVMQACSTANGYVGTPGGGGLIDEIHPPLF